MKLLDRARAILLTPRTEWLVIEQEPISVPGLLLGYVAPLAAIPEVANLIGRTLIGGYKPVVPGLLRAVVAYVVTLVVVYITAIIINLLAPRFGGKRAFGNALKLSVYSQTPLWLAGTFLLIPGLNFLVLLGGLLGLRLSWIGLPLLMGSRDDRAFPYALIVIACALAPGVVLSIL
jgi:hypothetical protein